MELKRLGATAREMAYDDGDNAKPLHRLLDGTRPADDPAGRQMDVVLKAVGVGL